MFRWFGSGDNKSKNTGFTPVIKPEIDNTKPSPYPIPQSYQTDYNPLQQCVAQLSDAERSLNTWRKKIADFIDQLKLEEPVSPRVTYSFLARFDKVVTIVKEEKSKEVKSKEEKKEEKVVTKASAFSKDAIDEAMYFTLKETKGIFSQLEVVDASCHKKHENCSLIKLCELNQELTQKHQTMLNTVQVILQGWRIAEDTLKLVMVDFKLSSLSESTQELVDRWLFEKIEGSAAVLFDLIRKAERDLQRAEAHMKHYMAHQNKDEKTDMFTGRDDGDLFTLTPPNTPFILTTTSPSLTSSVSFVKNSL